MKRLTKKEQLAGHTVNYVCDDNCFDVWSVPKKFMGNAIDRLAAYEDTGLEPKDIVALTRHPDFAIADYYKSLGLTMERITELAQADREGRCVVLPPDDYTWAIRGDIVRGIIKANCRAAKKDAEAALRREQE